MPEANVSFGDDLDLLIAAARRAGDIALSHFNRAPEIWQKADASPVTEADLAVDKMLRTDLLAARDDYGWLSEETEDDAAARQGKARVFVVDPIDGTRAFIDGNAAFAHSIAVVKEGVPVAGVVYLPALDKLYAAALGQGATLNGQPIRASTVSGSQAQVLATRATLSPEHWPGGMPQIERVYRPSLAYRLALVAQGRFDGMVTLRDSWEWDIAAGAVIAAEAGATVTDGAGGALGFNREPALLRGVVVAGAALHADVMRHRGV